MPDNSAKDVSNGDANDGAAANAVAPVDSSPPSKEAEVWAGRSSWKHFAGRLCLWALGSIVYGIVVVWAANRLEWLTFWRSVGMVLAGVVLSGLLVVGKVFWHILGCRYRLTSQRLFLHRGILNQKVDQIELIRIDDVSLEMSFVERLLGVGSVNLISTDATDRTVCIQGIESPGEVAEAIRKHTRSLRRKSLFVESL